VNYIPLGANVMRASDENPDRKPYGIFARRALKFTDDPKNWDGVWAIMRK
jgi:hypothetical protein